MVEKRKTKNENPKGSEYLYFEKQLDHYCLKHAINNLFGRKLVTIEMLESQVDEMYKIYKGAMPKSELKTSIGDYQIQVGTLLLEKEYCIRREEKFATWEYYEGNNLFVGYLINIRGGDGHYVSVKHKDRAFYYMESKSNGPELCTKGDIMNRLEDEDLEIFSVWLNKDIDPWNKSILQHLVNVNTFSDSF